MKFLIGLLIGLLLGYSYGWVSAHIYVAEECKRLGGFFVGKEIFRCEPVDQDPPRSAD